MQTTLKLFAAVFIVSWASILVRWIGDIHPLVIAFYRLLFSAILLGPLVLFNGKIQRIASSRHLFLLILAGFLLALHFYSWISSLQMTTIGRSVFLESTHPAFAVVLSIFFLKEKVPRSFMVSLLLGLIGMYLTVYGDLKNSFVALQGDFLALFSAFCMAGYLIIARHTRAKIPLLFYLFFVYSFAAVLIFGAILAAGINFSKLAAQTWMLLLLLAIGPNLLGHSLLNWASRKMPVYRVNMALLSESVLATLMAGIFFREIPDLIFISGAVLIILSIAWVFLAKKL